MFIYRLQQTEETSDRDTVTARGPWFVRPFRFWLPLTKSHGCGFPWCVSAGLVCLVIFLTIPSLLAWVSGMTKYLGLSARVLCSLGVEGDEHVLITWLGSRSRGNVSALLA